MDLSTTTTTTTTTSSVVPQKFDEKKNNNLTETKSSEGSQSSNENRSSPQTKKQKKQKITKTKAAGNVNGNTSQSSVISNTTKKTRARGSMYGLSSLKRSGNVRITNVNDLTRIRSNFLLGPLTLKVTKSFGRGNKRELRSATATTTEMHGRIILEIRNGMAILKTIKVQQPKQVQIETPGRQSINNNTRDMLWKKDYNIAQVVTDKLTSVTDTLLRRSV